MARKGLVKYWALAISIAAISICDIAQASTENSVGYVSSNEDLTNGMSFSYPNDPLASLLSERKYEQAIRYLSEQAISGNLDAHNNLGIIFYRGIGVEPDLPRAFRYFYKASEANWLFYSAFTYMVRIAQIRLIEDGLDPGPVDGELGPRTIAAINQKYGHAKVYEDGLSGNLPLLEKIVLGKPAEPIVSESPQLNVISVQRQRRNAPERSALVLNSLITVDSATSELSPIEVYRKSSPSVYVIYAISGDKKSIEGSSRSQGSAVAISETDAVTNCHVLEGSRAAFLKRGDEYSRVELIAADADTDRCIIRSQDIALIPISAVRRQGKLAVGERVYSIGAPRGLEKTLGEGLVSGVRHDRGITYVQTSAPISPGSSGGGLFDGEGNLVGITTFLLNESQSLNFAIAADEFLRLVR